MKSRSLTLRIMVAAAIWIVLSVGIGGFVISQVFQASALRQFDQRLLEELDLLIVAVTRAPDDPAIRMTSPSFALVYSGLYWQAETEDVALHRSRSLYEHVLALPTNEAGIADGPDGQVLRVRTRDLIVPDGRVWRLATAANLADLAEAEAAFRRGLFLAGGVLTLALILAAIMVLRSALTPLAALRQAVNARQGSDPGLPPEDFPSEVAPLIHDLNAAFARNARLQQRGRMQAANLAHALKTPAAILRNEVDKARAGAALDLDIADTAIGQIADAARTHLSRVGSDDDGAVVRGQFFDAVTPLNDIIRAMRKLFPDITFSFDAPPGLDLVMAPAELQEIAGNLLENAAKFAASTVRMRLSALPRGGELTIEDDGPGVPEADLERIFQEGVRLDLSRSGSGLGLGIVDDLASRHGGGVSLSRSPLGGLRAVVSIPGA